MFVLTADLVSLRVEEGKLLTSGARNIYPCQFRFSREWEGVDRTAVFQAGEVKISMVLDGEDRCIIPHEVLAEPGIRVYAGVYGTKNGELVMPTVLCSLGMVHKGTELGEDSAEPAPEVYEQILAKANAAEAAARSLREDADDGKFMGATGPQGPQGIQGIQGEKGDKGERGDGVPEGGSPGQLMGKTESGTAWVDPPESCVQPDWTQNNPEAKDYVRNRPFYEVSGVLLDTVFVFDSGSNGAIVDFPMLLGSEYTLTIDGSVSTGVAKGFPNGMGMPDGAVYMGDGSIWNLEQTNDNYTLVYIDMDGIKTIQLVYTDPVTGLQAERDLPVKIQGSNTVQIPERFIPDRFAEVVKVTVPSMYAQWELSLYQHLFALFEAGKVIRLYDSVGWYRGMVLSVAYQDSMDLYYVTVATEDGGLYFKDKSSQFETNRDCLKIPYFTQGYDGKVLGIVDGALAWVSLP